MERSHCIKLPHQNIQRGFVKTVKSRYHLLHFSFIQTPKETGREQLDHSLNEASPSGRQTEWLEDDTQRAEGCTRPHAVRDEWIK